MVVWAAEHRISEEEMWAWARESKLRFWISEVGDVRRCARRGVKQERDIPVRNLEKQAGLGIHLESFWSCRHW